MIDKEKASMNMKKQWAKFSIAFFFYVLFIIWISPRTITGWILTLLGALFIFDCYVSKKVRWQWWKEAEGPVRFIMSWVDALIFALVAVYFINLFLFQNYVIPSSSLEKSLLTGDYLFVSKVSYGPRIPETPLTMPLTQHTLPIIKTKSYISWPHWDYRRMKGFGHVKLNDIVVFNYPCGDSVLTEERYQGPDFYGDIVYPLGMQIYKENNTSPVDPSKLSRQQQMDFFAMIYSLGRSYINDNPNEFGSVDHRPTDRCENYVKRCVGLPGQMLQVKNRIVYLNGKPNKEPDNVQYTYYVKFATDRIPDDVLKELDISMEDLTTLNQMGYMPLTKRAVAFLSKRKDLVKSIRLNTDAAPSISLYPHNIVTNWTVDNYGPIWIPKKGAALKLNMNNIAIYERPIRVYEHNTLVVKNNRIYINGKPARSYTFKMDYYWMMGDNRHNSEDSRYWGFVPEDHIVGKPIFIWWSSDPDRKGFSGVRWNRLFKWVDNIK